MGRVRPSHTEHLRPAEMARGVLLLGDMKTDKGPNQGEGDKVSARHYNREVREFIADGKVDEAAREAAQFVEAEPDEANRAERRARKGPHGAKVSIEELVAKGRTVIDRVRPIVNRVVNRVRSRLDRKSS